MTFKHKIAKGIALLDKHRPGWHDAIDLTKLNMGRGEFDRKLPATLRGPGDCGCILAQVSAHRPGNNGYGLYDDGINSLIADAGLMPHRSTVTRYALAVEHGFTVDSENLTAHDPDGCWAVLTREWIEAIQEKRNG